MEPKREKSAPENPPVLPTPFSCAWMVRRVTEDGPEWTGTHLKTWMSPKRHTEIDNELIWSPEKVIFGATEGCPGRTQETKEIRQRNQGEPAGSPHHHPDQGHVHPVRTHSPGRQ